MRSNVARMSSSLAIFHRSFGMVRQDVRETECSHRIHMKTHTIRAVMLEHQKHSTVFHPDAEFGIVWCLLRLRAELNTDDVAHGQPPAFATPARNEPVTSSSSEAICSRRASRSHAGVCE